MISIKSKIVNHIDYHYEYPYTSSITDVIVISINDQARKEIILFEDGEVIVKDVKRGGN